MYLTSLWAVSQFKSGNLKEVWRPFLESYVPNCLFSFFFLLTFTRYSLKYIIKKKVIPFLNIFIRKYMLFKPCSLRFSHLTVVFQLKWTSKITYNHDNNDYFEWTKQKYMQIWYLPIVVETWPMTKLQTIICPCLSEWFKQVWSLSFFAAFYGKLKFL